MKVRLLVTLMLTTLVPAAPIWSDSGSVEKLLSPAPAASLTGNLVASGDALYLSWLEELPHGHALRFSVLEGTTFSEPRTIHTSDEFFANWADFASMAPLADGRLVAHWLEKAAKGTYQYDIWTSLSDDAGRTWDAPARLHRDGTLSEHGFVSLVGYGDAGFAGVWLDGREFREGADGNAMTLRFTTFEDGEIQDDTLLDARVCECCQTTMARTTDGFFVAYRDRSPDEIRDIGFVRYANGTWTEPATLHDDGWQIAGCPVNGPQVAAQHGHVAVAWFTAAGDEGKVQVVFSDDDGASFGAPVRIDEGHPVGRVDIEAVGDGVVVSWIERGEGGRGAVKLRRVSASGTMTAPISLGETSAGRASGFPRMAMVDAEVFVTWTETYAGERPSRVQIAKVAFD